MVAFGLGLFIGLDREKKGRCGIRTYAAVCLGETLFTTIAENINDDITSISRIVANIVTGIGFLGAGIIYRNNDSKSSHGLTTAATVWCTAAVGVAIGLDMFFIAITASLMIYFLLSLERRKWYMQWKNKVKDTDNK